MALSNRVWTVRYCAVLLQRQLTRSSLPFTTRLQTRRSKSGGAVKGKKVDESATSSSDSSDVDLSRVCQGLDYHVNGEDPPLKEDNEYPDWLWQIAEPVKSHKELPEGSKEYWRRLNKYSTRNTNMIRKQSGL